MPLFIIAPVLGILFLAACNSNDADDPLEEVIQEEIERFPVVPSGFGEASTDFGIGELPEFLQVVPKLIEAGFGAAEIEEITQTANDLEVDEDATFNFDIVYQGEATQLTVFLFIDDIDLVASAFYTQPQLADEILAEIIRFFEGA